MGKYLIKIKPLSRYYQGDFRMIPKKKKMKFLMKKTKYENKDDITDVMSN